MSLPMEAIMFNTLTQLEDHFDFLPDGTVRIHASRIGIETVVEGFRDGATPEEIIDRYPTLTREQVYATITYYLLNKEVVEQYVQSLRTEQENAFRAWLAQHDPWIEEWRHRLVDKREHLLREGTLPLQYNAE